MSAKSLQQLLVKSLMVPIPVTFEAFLVYLAAQGRLSERQRCCSFIGPGIVPLSPSIDITRITVCQERKWLPLPVSICCLLQSYLSCHPYMVKPLLVPSSRPDFFSSVLSWMTHVDLEDAAECSPARLQNSNSMCALQELKLKCLGSGTRCFG